MNAESFRAYCLGKKAATEGSPFGPDNIVFKVKAKMFALLALDEVPPRVNLKCDPDLAEGLRAAHEAIIPGYHLNKRHWNTVILDGSLPERMVVEMIEDSYDLVVAKLPKSTQAELGWLS